MVYRWRIWWWETMLVLGGCATLVNPQKIVVKNGASFRCSCISSSFIRSIGQWKLLAISFFSQRHISRYHHGWLIHFQVGWNISIVDHSIWNPPFEQGTPWTGCCGMLWANVFSWTSSLSTLQLGAKQDAMDVGCFMLRDIYQIKDPTNPLEMTKLSSTPC